MLAAVELGNAAAALLPLPSVAATSFPQTERGTMELLTAARKVAMPPRSQAAGDAEAAAVLAYLAISYAALPGQPQPLNHPLFTGDEQPRMTGDERGRVEAVLGGAELILATKTETFGPDPSIDSAARRAQQLQRLRAQGLDVHLAPGGSLVLKQGVLEAELLPAGGSPPRDLHAVVRALLLASVVRALLLASTLVTLATTAGEARAARVLRRLAPVFDGAAALAQLGEQLAAAQERRGATPPRLPSAEQLLQLWLRMCVYAGECVPEAEGWPGIQAWATAAARRLVRLDSANPRAWQVLARCCRMVEGGLQQCQEAAHAMQRSLEAARAAGNLYHTAYSAFNIVLDSARLKRGCTPAEAAALLHEAEAAWAAVQRQLPEEWVTVLRRERAAMLTFQEVLQAHLRESPQVRHAG